MAPIPSESEAGPSFAPPKPLPKGVVLGKDGKPCRTCTDVASWKALSRSSKAASKPSTTTTTTRSSQSNPIIPVPAATITTSSPTPNSSTDSTADCPPDVAHLGRSTWTLLHSLTASYPPTAPLSLQSKTHQFLTLFSELYPCWVCAEDLQEWMARPGNEPKLKGREEFGLWMCQAHNEVNRKLGKEGFDCGLWKERWREGWRDGRCD